MECIAVCDRVDALSSVVDNLIIYSKQPKEAKKLGADIIVFPEVQFHIILKTFNRKQIYQIIIFQLS